MCLETPCIVVSTLYHHHMNILDSRLLQGESRFSADEYMVHGVE